MKLSIIVGTRPEIIKMAPVIQACQRRGIDFFILHTGQHYSPNMDKVFFEELGLPEPKYNLGIGNQPHRKQVGLMVREISKVFMTDRPDIAVVQGDTTSVLSACLAAKNLGIKIAHHEAGLRSHDPSMLEETNRVTADHISDFLFTPTQEAANNLIEEGCGQDRIHVTGNTIVDAVLDNKTIADKKIDILKKLGIESKKYFLFTAHRNETVDKKEGCLLLIDCLKKINIEFPEYRIVFPVHPRTEKMLEKFGLKIPREVLITEPFSYFDFLCLESNAKIIITDSGGLQEEACILKIPCITIRKNTERLETVRGEMNILTGLDEHKLAAAAREMLHKEIIWTNPFGDYGAGTRIIDLLRASYNNLKNNENLYE